MGTTPSSVNKGALVALLAVALAACSASGGVYKKDDPEHGEFSFEKTMLTVIGTIGAAVLIQNAPKDNEYNSENSWWDGLYPYGQ